MSNSLISLLQDPQLQRTALLLGPALLAALLVLVVKPTPRQATAAMVAFLWQLPALLLLHLLATDFGWWRFAAEGNLLLGLPIDLWVGWAIWWGPVAVFLRRWIPLLPLVAGMALLDLIAMPLLAPLVVLDPAWMIGEPVALGLCLLPALVFARLTEADRRPVLRTTFHALGWAGYTLFLLPSAALAYEGRDLSEALRLLTWADAGLGLLLLAGILVGLAGAYEFATEGDGTPIPFDPPKRVVVSGPYAFIANPMQLGSALMMAAQAAAFGSPALWLITVSFVVFDTVYATWYNRVHIARALPEDWRAYRRHVREWRFAWRGYRPARARLLLPDSSLANRILARALQRFGDGQLEVRAARCFVTERRVRLRYLCPEPTIEASGIVALGRSLEHLGLPFAACGWALRLPPVAALLEILAAGLPLRRAAARLEARLAACPINARSG